MCWLLPKGPNKLNAQSAFFPAMRQQLSADRETLEDCLATIRIVLARTTDDPASSCVPFAWMASVNRREFLRIS